LVSREIEETM